MISGKKPQTDTHKDSSTSVDSGFNTGATGPSESTVSRSTTQDSELENIPPPNSVGTGSDYVSLDQDEHLALDALKHKDEIDTHSEHSDSKPPVDTTAIDDNSTDPVINTTGFSEDYLNSTLNTSGASRQSELDSSTDEVVYLYRSLPKSAERRSTDFKVCLSLEHSR